MPSENVIYINLDFMEALKAKRSVLSSELGFLNIAKRIARYGRTRMEELELKARLYGKIREVKATMKKLQDFLPNPKIPEIIKKRGWLEEPSEEESEPYLGGGDIESQLREIQRRLDKLQRQNI